VERKKEKRKSQREEEINKRLERVQLCGKARLLSWSREAGACGGCNVRKSDVLSLLDSTSFWDAKQQIDSC